MAENLMEGLLRELDRNNELLKQYESIGPVGIFGATAIRKDIEDGYKAITESDTVQMVKSFQTLQGNK